MFLKCVGARLTGSRFYQLCYMYVSSQEDTLKETCVLLFVYYNCPTVTFRQVAMFNFLTDLNFPLSLNNMNFHKTFTVRNKMCNLTTFLLRNMHLFTVLSSTKNEFSFKLSNVIMIMKYHSTVMLFPSLYLYQCVRPGAVSFSFQLVKHDCFWYKQSCCMWNIKK